MQMTINSKPVSELSPGKERAIWLRRKNPVATSMALTAEAANAAFRSEKAAILVGIVVLTALICLIGWAVSSPKEKAALWLVIAVGLFVPICVCADYYFEWDRWSKSLPERVRMAPPPGTSIRLDDEGLRIGESFAAWSDFDVERVDLVESGFRIIYYEVRGLAVRAPGLSFLLDCTLLQNGQAIADEIYRRKCRPVLREQEGCLPEDQKR